MAKRFDSLSIADARRIALAAQGFDTARPQTKATQRHVDALISRLGVIQIDSVNVLVRSQELPLFARLGNHDRNAIPMSTEAQKLFGQINWRKPPKRADAIKNRFNAFSSLLWAVTTDEEWPRAVVMRGRTRKGSRYFGPYPHAYAIRDTLDLLLRTFPIRTCSQGKFNQHNKLGRPCLLFHIEKCSGPCVGEVSADAYSELVKEFCDFLDGDTDEVVAKLQDDMNKAAAALEYEKAARLRDRLQSVAKAIEKQQIVGEKSEDIDLIGIAQDELEAAIQIFYVRKGRVVGRKGFILDKVEDLSQSGLIDRIIEALYGDEPVLGVPKMVLVAYSTKWMIRPRCSLP